MSDKTLTTEEKFFCELYVTGDAGYAGDAGKCYKVAFGTNNNTGIKALRLLSEERIQKYVDELKRLGYEEAEAMKRFLTKNLKNIVTECSTAEYKDRRGTKLSPAPLRSVAVNAAKALMDMYPIKEATKNKISLDSEGEGNITFNVIVPEKKKETDED